MAQAVDREVPPPAGKTNFPAKQSAQLPMTGADADKLNKMLGDRHMSLEQFQVLQRVVFPTAKTREAIFLAIDYCKARGLDVMKKTVHIVPTYVDGKEVETIWPAIAEARITAHRTGAFAGNEECEYGEDITREFDGTRWEKGVELACKIEVTFPKWAKFTVYRIVHGEKRAFSAKLFWMETYTKVKKGSMCPNDRWQRAPYGQLEKCAEAAALRRGFSEEFSEHTAEEMEGRELVEVPETGAVTTKSVKNAVNAKAQKIAEAAAVQQTVEATDDEIHDVEEVDEENQAEDTPAETTVQPTQQEKFQAAAEVAQELGASKEQVEALKEIAQPGITSKQAQILMNKGKARKWQPAQIIASSAELYNLDAKKWNNQMTERQWQQMCIHVEGTDPPAA
ncbi:MAG TPA: phage recombination protein Bet [Drouetiella sp.]